MKRAGFGQGEIATPSSNGALCGCKVARGAHGSDIPHRIQRPTHGVKQKRSFHLSTTVTFGQLEDEVPGVPNESATGLEQRLLQTREGPTLDGDRQNQPTQQVAEVVGDDPEQEADLVGPEPVAGEARPVAGSQRRERRANRLRYLALNDPRIAMTSRPRLPREYVYVARDQAANA